MRKSTIVVLSGIFIVSTIMLCTNTNKTYEKNKKFSSKNEIIEIINHKQIGALDKNKEFVTTSDFKECLSKRKRVTASQLDYYKIDGEVLPEKNTKEKNDLLISQYKLNVERLKGYKIPDKIEALTLTGKAYSVGELYAKDYISATDNVDINIIFIDEGEGLVIDYFWVSSNDNEKTLYEQ